MLTHTIIGGALSLVVVLSVRPAGAKRAGERLVSNWFRHLFRLLRLYRGISAVPLSRTTPKLSNFAVDGSVATMTILGADGKTIFSIIPCPPDGPIGFSFHPGVVFPDHIVFHADPGPLPYRHPGITRSAIQQAASGLMAR